MTDNGAAEAWSILKRNPRYIADWHAMAGAAPPALPETAPFPLRTRSSADRGAAKWGLLAWEDPGARDDGPSPFWTDAPAIEGETVAANAARAPALLPLLRKAGARLSGLCMPGGALLLNIESEDAAMQVWIADGRTFDPAGGLVLRVPFGLDLPVNIAHARDLWAVAGARTKKAAAAAAGWITANCCSPSTAHSPARPIAA